MKIQKMVRKTTSLKVEEEVWKKMKIKCINLGEDLSVHMENLMLEDLKKK